MPVNLSGPPHWHHKKRTTKVRILSVMDFIMQNSPVKASLSPFKPLYKQGWCLGLCQPLCSEPGAHRGSGWVEKSTTLKAAPTNSASHKRRTWVLTYRRSEGIHLSDSQSVGRWVASWCFMLLVKITFPVWTNWNDARLRLFNLIYLSAVIINTSVKAALPPSQRVHCKPKLCCRLSRKLHDSILFCSRWIEY